MPSRAIMLGSGAETTNDGGVDVSTDGGETWYAAPLPISQFYHVSADESVPYRVSGAMQDLGTAAGPSNSLSSAGITLGHWHEVGGGEAGYTAHDPSVSCSGVPAASDGLTAQTW